MLAVALVAVFLITLALAWLALKIVPFFMDLRKWHQVLDDNIPHDPLHPILGSLHKMETIKGFADDAMRKFIEAGYKSYVYWVGFTRPVVVVSHPDTVKAILRTSEPKARGAGGYNFLEPWLGDGLLVSNGRKWERNRRLLTPAFHFDILQPYVKIYNHSVRGFMKNIAKLSKGGNSVEVFGPASLATLDTMLQCTLSYDDDIQEKGSSHPYVQAVNRLAMLTMNRFRTMSHHITFFYNLSSKGREYNKLTRYVHEFSQEVIGRRKLNLEKDPDLVKKKRHLDFLDILLTARDETGQGLTDKEIRDEVDTFMFEGHDTTSSAISWCLYCLALYPEEQQKVLHEVLQVVGDKEEVEWEDLSKIPYVTMFIRETLRLYPPVPAVARTLTGPLLVDGVELPRGVSLEINMYQTQSNPHVWPEPLEFKPERFDPDTSAGRDPYSFVPFSAGPRNCIGQVFALNEIKVMVCQIVKSYHVELDPHHEPKQVFELVLRSENGLYLKFTPRL